MTKISILWRCWAVSFCISCSTPEWQQLPHDLRFQYVPAPQLHPLPEPRMAYEWSDILEQTTAQPIGRILSPQHWIDKARHGPMAQDINRFGEVVDSAWFTNRIGRGNPSLTKVVDGPPPSTGPELGPLVVTRAKITGASPGLVLEDAAGQPFIAKFDPPAYPGLASGAEIITTHILHAAGYNVPENSIRFFSMDDLVIDPKASSITKDKLRSILQLANPDRTGNVRALMSRVIDGQPVGPFAYQGQRHDDPNDHIPHERRRSLRGYRWFCAWTNNTDTRASNTLDVFRASPKNEHGFLVHYLIDFGNALGSLGVEPKYASDGYDPLWSWTVVGELFLSLGLRYRYWLPIRRSPHRSVGFFEADVFEPKRWSPAIPNPAFQASTPLDAFWAASVMAEFTRPMIAGIVAKAKYPSTLAAQYVADTLWQRRNKILTMAFAKVSPLHHFRVDATTVHFEDLAVREQLEPPTRYRFSLRGGSGGTTHPLGIRETSAITLSWPPGSLPIDDPSPFVILTIERAQHIKSDTWGPPVHLYLRALKHGYTTIGLKREVS